MRLTTIEARDLNETWWKCLKEILAHGYEYSITRGSGGSEGQRRKELDAVSIHVINPGIRPLVPDVPEGVPPPVSMDYIETQYLPYLLLSEKQPKETYTYGMYLEDQLAKIVKIYQETGFETNQATATVGDSTSIYLDDPPCLRLIDTRVRYGKLHWFAYFRSWDCWAGLPANLAGLQLAKEMMASELEVSDGELFVFSKGLHLYEYTWDLAKTVTHYVPQEE